MTWSVDGSLRWKHGLQMCLTSDLNWGDEKKKKICYWHEYSWKFFQIFLGIFFLPSVFFFGLKNNEAKSTWQIKEKIFKIKHWLIRDLQTQNSRLQIYHRVVLLKLKIVRHPTSRTISDQSINYIKKSLLGTKLNNFSGMNTVSGGAGHFPSTSHLLLLYSLYRSTRFLYFSFFPFFFF